VSGRWFVPARLDDPHIIPIHDYGTIDDQLFIDRRMVRGTDLAKLLKGGGPLPAARAVGIVSQVASALDAAHAEGLVHRDVKPSNVLITGTQEFAYLVDFGIARAFGVEQTALTMVGSTMGTLAYMAPERFTDRGGDHRVDVYALACVLYEMLTADPPFRTSGMPAMIHAHLTRDPPRPSEHNAGIPTGLDAVVARGMAKDVDARYPSAGEFAAAARQALAAATVAAPGPLVIASAPVLADAPVATEQLSPAITEVLVDSPSVDPLPASGRLDRAAARVPDPQVPSVLIGPNPGTRPLRRSIGFAQRRALIAADSVLVVGVAALLVTRAVAPGGAPVSSYFAQQPGTGGLSSDGRALLQVAGHDASVFAFTGSSAECAIRVRLGAGSTGGSIDVDVSDGDTVDPAQLCPNAITAAEEILARIE